MFHSRERACGTTRRARGRHAGAVYIGSHEIEFIGAGESNPTVRSHFGPLILTQHQRMVMDGSMRTTLEQRYRFTDVLGSTVALTDAFGAIEFAESRMGFDAWGQRRDPVTGLPLSGANAAGFPVRDTTDRGYTGQRHEDSAGLVHLGARWYDPVTGRFVQADSIIGEAGNSQAYNFYSYALNNPLAYTDPSGHWGQQEQAYLRAAVAIVIAAYTGWYIGAAELTGSAAIGTAALGGAAAGAVASGNLRGAVTGAFSGMLFYGIGTGFSQANAGWAYSGNSLNTAGWAAKTAAHGFAGGIMGELEGDKFGHGFVAAGFTQSMSGVIGRMPNPGSRIVVAAVVGGTASELSGGKFANGAVAAGFSATFSGVALQVSQNSRMSQRMAAATAFSPESAIAWGWGEPLPAGLVNGVAGFGDALSFGATSWYREWQNIGSVSYSSGVYQIGQAGGVVFGFAMGGVGGLSGGARSVFWSGAGNMERAAMLGRSLEMTPIGATMNRFGSRIPHWGWKAASCIYACNARGTAIKVGVQQGAVWRSIEKPILHWRGIPYNVVP